MAAYARVLTLVGLLKPAKWRSDIVKLISPNSNASRLGVLSLNLDYSKRYEAITRTATPHVKDGHLRRTALNTCQEIPRLSHVSLVPASLFS